jgi:hypothetical protein
MKMISCLHKDDNVKLIIESYSLFFYGSVATHGHLTMCY